MARLARAPRTLLFFSLLSLASACDHTRSGPLGPLDVIEDKEKDSDAQVSAYVEPVELELDWTLLSNKLPAEQASEAYARIRIEAPDELSLPPPPARVVLVVDTSASMKGDAIVGAKQAAEELVETLRDGDQFALVVFHSSAEVLLPMTAIDDESRALAKAKIEQMQAWGTTDLASGLRLALNEFNTPIPTAPTQLGPEQQQAYVGGVLPPTTWLERIVLLGDGVPNERSSIPGLALEAAGRRISITALGYGLDFDETVLASLATATNGHYRFVEDPAAVAGLFRDEVLDIQRTVAQDVRLSVAPGPGVSVLEVVGRTIGWNPNTARYEVNLGSMSEGGDQELLVRLGVGSHRDGATIELLDLGLDFIDMQTGTGARTEQAFLSAEASADAQARLASEDPELAREVARARTNAATLTVTSLARGGDLKGAKAALREAVAWARGEAKRLGDDALLEQADSLAALEKELASLVPPPSPVAGAAPTAVDMAFAPAPAAPSADGSRALRQAHSEAFRELHD